MRDIFSLEGKVALVTGASRGLGLAMARHLAAFGAHVVVNGRDPETLKACTALIAADGGSASDAAFDVTDPSAAAAAVDAIVGDTGGLDILVNNAGKPSRALLEDLDLDEWQRTLDLNLTAAFVLARAAAKPMAARGWGRIVNTASVMAFTSRAEVAAYAASKHGIAGLTKVLATELGPKGITVNALCPGYFRTELTQALQDDPVFNAWIDERVPLGRWGDPAELGGTVVYLASSAGAYVNGHLLVVDGGQTVHI